MGIRQALAIDCEKVVGLEKYSFDYTDTYSAKYKERFSNIYDQYLVAEEEGELLASGRIIPFEQNIRGCWKHVGALGSLATATESRRQGIARNLMDCGINLMHEKGFASSLLYPFNDSFYSAFGFINCPPILSITANPNQLRKWKMPVGYSVCRRDYSEGREVFQKVHDKYVEKTHGAIRRGIRRWDELCLGNDCNLAFVKAPSGDIEGIMIYRNTGYNQFGDNKTVGTMEIKEWYCLSCEARIAFLNYIYLHSGQIKKVSIPLDPVSDDYFHWVEDRNVPVIQARRSYMIRLINVELALVGIPVIREGYVTIEIIDPYCKWNNGIFKLENRDGNLDVMKVDAEPESKMTIEAITALAYGVADVSTLRCLKWIDGLVPDVFEDWFARCNMWMTEDF
ncbi:MAG: GNAT family N-acetyltransferase [Candidatus Thorarchaeota archaeon]|nr:GNAT family N-acetyltransferase [Candidatus Thorarchaeota archaeon]